VSLLVHLTVAMATAPALATTDPIAVCRAEHSHDAGAYTRCLEAALRAVRDHDHAEPEAGTARDAGPESETSVDTDSSIAEPSGLGAEQVRDTARESEEQEVSVVIVGTSYNHAGLGTFRLADGQVWRETTPSPRRRHLDPETQYAGRIVRGKVSGYRLHVEGVRWMKTVKRIE